MIKMIKQISVLVQHTLITIPTEKERSGNVEIELIIVTVLVSVFYLSYRFQKSKNFNTNTLYNRILKTLQKNSFQKLSKS